MSCFWDKLFPDVYIKSVFELPVDKLIERGIHTLVFDIDNTIAPFDVAEPEENIIELFAYLKKQGFQICILSNNNKKRITIFNRRLRALAVYGAGKPGTKKLLSALQRMHTTPGHAAMIGDQVFTDMWCGHRAGMYCIMTAPICNRDQLVTKVKRGLERQVMKLYFRRLKKERRK